MNIKKAFTLIELLFTSIIITIAITISYYFFKDFFIPISIDPTAAINDVKIDFCKLGNGNYIENDSCKTYKIQQMSFGNTGFVYEEIINNGVGISETNKNKIILNDYVSSGYNFRSAPKSLYGFYQNIVSYNNNVGCPAEEKGAIYKIKNTFYDCHFDKIKYLTGYDIGIYILDGILYLK